ncbi:hypothetical protein DID88_005597 [Monilinia fructigena]|uniref:Uncharacterized protein n=1 Tax=Monilinia fructigena TaxID=38457 RepID=A0A395J101_9HELO|nr:hypothetical protein DID88_005597 [Monilinia fructigena]
MKQSSELGERVFEETCDLLLHATGILNNFKWPDIKGIEKFKGRVIHTARWPIGQNGVDLRKKWKEIPESYLGLTVPDIPNFITFIASGVRIAVPGIEITKPEE